MDAQKAEMTNKPSLAVKVGDISLKTPLIAASGTFGYGREFADYLDMDEVGGFVTKGISLEPRQGNAQPRICETNCGMLNAIGLANVGLKVFLEEKLPLLQDLKAKCIVNLYGESKEEFVGLAKALEGQKGISALELNVSCPNVKGGGMAFGQDPDQVFELTKAVKDNSSFPLWVKLTPNVADPRPMALSAAKAGASAISLINTLLAMAIDPKTRKPKLANVYGGLSGPAIKPVGLRMVHQVASAVDVPVVGMGGITNGQDVAEYLLAGASAVQVGTGNFADPCSMNVIANELAQFLLENNISDVNELVKGLIC